LTNLSKSDAASRGVIIFGDTPFVDSYQVNELAQHLGWPVLPEPTAAPWLTQSFIAHAPLVVEQKTNGLVEEVETILAIGRVGLSRPINALLNKVNVAKYWAHAPALVSRPGDFHLLPKTPDSTDVPKGGLNDWYSRWRRASEGIEKVIGGIVDGTELTGVTVARMVTQNLEVGEVLHLGSSYPARDVEMYAAQSDGRAFGSGGVTVYMNRGVNGIDGVVSTAMGEALATGRSTYLLCGDLTLLHDLNGLMLGPEEPCPDLTLVVIDNDGGGIFSTLENVGVAGFERVIATPVGKDIVAILQAIGVKTELAENSSDLHAALKERPSGLRAVVARVGTRAKEADLRSKLRESILN
jgi:2-succinyl-5-enolpyruvyl-6-hydroxy-3-cyclohexene-1-carboxylate synthase